MKIVTMNGERKKNKNSDQLASFREKLVSIRAKSAEKLREKIGNLAKAWQSMLEGDSDSVYLREMHAISHQVSGSGATLGFSQLSRLASTLDTLITCLIDHDRRVSPEEHEQLGSFVLALRDSIASIDSQILSDYDESQFEQPSRLGKTIEKNLYLVGKPGPDDEALLKLIKADGFTLQIFEDWHDLDNALLIALPDAVIVKTAMKKDDQDVSLRESRLLPNPVPVLYLPEENSFAERLNAVRHGVTSVIPAPYDPQNVIRWLDDHCISFSPEPYRVLVVDDDVPLADYYAFLLQEVGMVTQVVNKPEDTLEAIQAFNPEIVLMDVYMPNWNGIEVAAAIRQFDEYAALPIVFLSRESDLSARLSGLERGGDNFLTKPISPNHLASVVSSRANRFRQILKSTRARLEGVRQKTIPDYAVFSDISKSMSKRLEQLMSEIRIARESILSSTDQETHLESAFDEGRALHEDLGIMQEIARLKSDPGLMLFERFDIEDLLQECVRAVRPGAGKRNISLNIDDKACIATYPVYADFEKVTELLLSLLANVIQNTADAGEVSISCDVRDETIRISMKYPRSNVSNMNVDDSYNDPLLIFGVSLALTRSLVELMHGDIGLHQNSREEALLWLELPGASPGLN